MFHSVPGLPWYVCGLPLMPQLYRPRLPPLGLAHWVQHVAWLFLEFPIHPKVGLPGHAVPCASRRPRYSRGPEPTPRRSASPGAADLCWLMSSSGACGTKEEMGACCMGGGGCDGCGAMLPTKHLAVEELRSRTRLGLHVNRAWHSRGSLRRGGCATIQASSFRRMQLGGGDIAHGSLVTTGELVGY